MSGFKYSTGGVNFQVTGADRLKVVGKLLADIDDKALKAEYTKGIRQATKPLTERLRKSARETLPRRGGLNERVAKTRISTSITTGTRSAGVRLRDPGGKNAKDVQRINAGTVRHPTYGHRPWVNQAVTPGWWDRVFEDPNVKTETAKAIEHAIDDFIKRRFE